MATRGGVLVASAVAVGIWASSAMAGPRSIAIAVGDCRDPELLNGGTAFADAVSGLVKTDAVDAAALLERLRPRPNAGLDDVQRQLDGAQSAFYSGQLEPSLEVVRSAVKSLERLSPSEAVTKQLVVARVLEGLILKALNRKNEQLEAWRRVLRVQPDYKLDPDFHTPAAIQQFDQLKKDLAKTKKVQLNVSSNPAGAAVFVDGTPAGKTPLKGAAFIPGVYRVTVTQGELQSFVYDVKLDSAPVDLVVDLKFEGSLRPQLPLCVSGTDIDALKLAQRAAADQALLLRVESRNNEPGWVQAVLYDVAKGMRVREGGMKVAAARQRNGYSDLASFVLTGQPATLALSSAMAKPAAEAAPVKTEAAPPPAPVVVNDTPAAEPSSAPAEEVAASSTSGGGGVPRFIPLAVAGVGVVLGVTGLIVYATGSAERAALAGALDANGQVKDPADAENAAFLDQRIQSNKTTSLALGITGAALAATGAVLFFVLAPKDAPQPTALVTPNGAYVGLTGSF